MPLFLQPSDNESVKEVSEIRTQRAIDLVRQPSRWGARPLRAVGPDTRGSKATLNPTSSTSLSVHPISSSGTAGDGLKILSEACAPRISAHLASMSLRIQPNPDQTEMSIRHPDELIYRHLMDLRDTI